jgi:hypothetical protein
VTLIDTRLFLEKRTRTAGFVVVSAALMVLAFLGGWDAVVGLRWPFGSDLFRNIANAVTFKDGGVLSDAHYAGVPAWYSPLTSALLGFGSLVTGISVNRLGTQAGAVLNLLTPIVLCGVTARWFGRRVAVLALLAYLFVLGANYPPWAVASYSPWLFVNIYATGFFILALAAVPAAVNRGSTSDALALGVVAGIVLLAHPASAVLLVPVAGVQFLRACWHAEHAVLRRLARSIGISLVTALVVSAPFWVPIMIRYQWSVANSRAGTYSWPAVDVHHVWAFFRDFVWRWPTLVVAIGLAIWIGRRHWRTARPARARAGAATVDGVSILVAWTAFAFVAFLLEVYRDSSVVGLVPLPDSPSHHYLLALTVALCIWFGIALNTIVQTVLGRFDERWGAVAVVGVVAIVTVLALPGWRDRTDLVDGRAEAKTTLGQLDDFRVVDWIRGHTRSDEIFLNIGPGTWNGVLLPGLAGRKSVDINIPEFSNPFVDYNERQRAATGMVDALRACRAGAFEKLAKPYGDVRYIITQAGSGIDSPCANTMRTVYADKSVSIQAIARRRP